MPNLKALAALQDVDTELMRAQNRLREIAALLGNDSSLSQAREAAKTAETQVARLRAAQRDRELAVDSTRKGIEEREAVLYSGRVTNPRELEAMRQEVESLRVQVAKGEEEALGLLDQLQAAQAVLSERAAAKTAAEARWAESQAALRQEQATLTERSRVQAAHRRDMAAAIEPNVLAAYDRLRAARAGVAVARLERDLCSACKVGIPTNLVSRVRGGKDIVYCPTCGRMLAP